jgi:hypothetical protein
LGTGWGEYGVAGWTGSEPVFRLKGRRQHEVFESICEQFNRHSSIDEGFIVERFTGRKSGIVSGLTIGILNYIIKV